MELEGLYPCSILVIRFQEFWILSDMRERFLNDVAVENRRIPREKGNNIVGISGGTQEAYYFAKELLFNSC